MEIQLTKALEEIKTYFKLKNTQDITVKPLAGGYSNATNFLLTIESKSYVLRYFPELQSIQSRENERLVTQLMGERSLGPMLHYYDSNNKFLLIEFIMGQQANVEALINPTLFKSIIKTLYKVHQLLKIYYKDYVFATEALYANWQYDEYRF